jgi:hypothetical protein
VCVCVCVCVSACSSVCVCVHRRERYECKTLFQFELPFVRSPCQGLHGWLPTFTLTSRASAILSPVSFVAVFLEGMYMHIYIYIDMHMCAQVFFFEIGSIYIYVCVCMCVCARLE